MSVLHVIFFIGLYFSGVCCADADIKKMHRPLKILFVVGHFPAASQIFILNIMTGLIDRGHKVSIFSFHKDKKYENVHPNVDKYKLWNAVEYEHFKHGLPDCDIVFCQFGYTGQRMFATQHFAKWLRKRKVVTCFRGSDITLFTQDNPHLYDKLFNKGDLFLPVCDYFKKRLTDLGCPAQKIIVHHSAIDCTQFLFKIRIMPRDGIIRCISVSRLVEKKGIDYALMALAQVVKKYPRMHFTIVGDGPEKKYLEHLTRQLGLQDKVKFYGWAMQKEIVALLNRSHIFLLPSRTGDDGNEEGIPNALKEAMASGVIPISTWHAGNAELIDDRVSGFLVPEKNADELAKAIEYVIENPQQWESIGRSGRKKVKDEFETKKSVKRLEEIFYELLDSSKAKDALLDDDEDDYYS